MTNLSPAEYGAYLASLEPPISDAQAEAAARILLSAQGDAAKPVAEGQAL